MITARISKKATIMWEETVSPPFLLRWKWTSVRKRGTYAWCVLTTVLHWRNENERNREGKEKKENGAKRKKKEEEKEREKDIPNWGKKKRKVIERERYASGVKLELRRVLWCVVRLNIKAKESKRKKEKEEEKEKKKKEGKEWDKQGKSLRACLRTQKRGAWCDWNMTCAPH